MYVTMSEVRLNIGELLEAISNGEEVVITSQGQPCARLVPVSERKESYNAAPQNLQAELFGVWRDHDRVSDVESYIREVRKGQTNDHRQ